MRKVLWSLGAIGAVGLALTVSTAQDRITGSSATKSAGSQRSGSYTFLGRGAKSNAEEEPAAADSEVQRYSRNRTGAPAANSGSTNPNTGLRNYEKELFGVGTSAGTKPSATAKAQTNSRLPVKDERIRQTGANDELDKTSIRQAGGALEDGEGKEALQQADYTKPAGKSDAIKQVTNQKAALLPEGSEASGLKGGLMLLPDSPPSGATASKLPKRPEVKPAATGAKDTLIRKPTSLSAAPKSGSTGPTVNFSTDSPRITTEWKKLSDFNVGSPCSMELIVTNAGGAAAADVAVDIFLPASIRITDSKPEPTSVSDRATWRFPSLNAGEERRIALSMIPSERGEIAANANVRYTAAASTKINVEEPMLKLAVTGPQEVSVGEAAPHVVTIANPGTGVAHNVSLEVNIPAGLEHPKGNRLVMDLGALAPNETRTVKLSLVAKTGGDQSIRVEAKAGADLHQSAASKMVVLAPSLKLDVSGPAIRYVGRDARYVLAVKNDGATTNNNVRAVFIVPKGFQFVQASNGGTFDDSSRLVTWFLGSIDAGKEMELSLKLRPTELGDYPAIAKVVSEHGASSEAKTMTKVDGAASLVLEVLDLEDPVEVGKETAYEVRVRNDGSKEAQNVGLSVELPTAISLVGVKAPVEYIAESGLVVFKSLPQLPPGKTAIFQITVKGRDEGNQRLRARLTSESIQEPLTVEELTKFYAD